MSIHISPSWSVYKDATHRHVCINTKTNSFQPKLFWEIYQRIMLNPCRPELFARIHTNVHNIFLFVYDQMVEERFGCQHQTGSCLFLAWGCLHDDHVCIILQNCQYLAVRYLCVSCLSCDGCFLLVPQDLYYHYPLNIHLCCEEEGWKIYWNLRLAWRAGWDDFAGHVPLM